MAPMHSFISALFLGMASAATCPSETPNATVISTTVFNSVENMLDVFAYNYPWGTDHNGGARMNETQVAVGDGFLNLTSKFVTGQPATASGIKIDYLSGTVHSKANMLVPRTGGLLFSADFLAPTEKGCWPAFWLSGAKTWPPEIDMAEWKGDGNVSFNTFNTSSQVTAQNFDWPNDEDYHNVKIWVRDVTGVDVRIDWWMDNKFVTSQVGLNMTEIPFYFIIDFQMEGSSGSPGPTGESLYSIRWLDVVTTNNASTNAYAFPSTK